MVGDEIASVDNRIAHGFIWVINANFGANTPSKALRCAFGHLFEMFEILLNRVVTVFRRNAVHALITHLKGNIG